MSDWPLIMIKAEDLERIVAAGVAAPSADNSQPWLYRPHDAGIDIWIDGRRSDSPSNAGYVLSDLAVGAVVENLCLQAGALGYACQVEYFPTPQAAPLWVARLRWSRTGMGIDPLAAAIPERHTDRRFPFKGPVTGSALQALAEQAGRYPGTALVILDDAASRRTALRLLRRAETLRFRYRPLHQELFSHVRWDAGWQGIGDAGLSPASLAVEAPMRPLFKSLRHWRLMSVMNWLGTAAVLGMRAAYLPARLSPALVLLTARDAERSTIVQAGRALQRVWLQATLSGLAVQPFAAAGLFTLGKMDLGPPFRRDVKPLQAMMEALCPPQQHGLVFLRLGYPPHSSPPRSGRRATVEFLART
jgi:nitroreductase